MHGTKHSAIYQIMWQNQGEETKYIFITEQSYKAPAISMLHCASTSRLYFDCWFSHAFYRNMCHT